MQIAINGMFWNQPNTGSGQYVRALVAELTRREPGNAYAIITPSANPARRAALRDSLAKVWFEQMTFGRACARRNAALAHVPYFASPLFPRTRTIVTIHDLIPMILPLYRGSALVRAYTQLVALAAKRADAIIADSECSRHDIIARLQVEPTRVQVIYLAADPRFQPVIDPAPLDAVRSKYNLPEKFVLYLGGYDQRKNVRVIIQAFARLPEFYRAGVRLVLAGVKLGDDSAFFPDPRRIARDAGTHGGAPLPDDAIQYLGWVDEADKPALYASATAFVFPSLYEGFGLPPLEAMACGTPVIASNASSLPEIIGDAGITIEPNDGDAWAEAMRTVLTDESQWQAMRARGLAQAQKFSWERTAQETLKVYAHVIPESHE